MLPLHVSSLQKSRCCSWAANSLPAQRQISLAQHNWSGPRKSWYVSLCLRLCFFVCLLFVCIFVSNKRTLFFLYYCYQHKLKLHGVCCLVGVCLVTRLWGILCSGSVCDRGKIWKKNFSIVTCTCVCLQLLHSPSAKYGTCMLCSMEERLLSIYSELSYIYCNVAKLCECLQNRRKKDSVS